MSADRHLTPRVIAHLRATLPTIPVERRVGFERAQLVLRQLCRWARMIDADDPGRWRSGESVEQIAAGTGLTDGTIRRALDNLEQVGLVVTLRRGGGRGTGARGSTRLLLLDPVDNRRTPRGYRAEFRPQLRAVAPETARGSGETARGQPRDTASSSASSSARFDDRDTTPAWFAERMSRALAPTTLADQVMSRERFVEAKRRAAQARQR